MQECGRGWGGWRGVQGAVGALEETLLISMRAVMTRCLHIIKVARINPSLDT